MFNFFFTVPRFTFRFNDPDYPVTFTIMFMISFLTGSLAARLKENAKQAAHSAFRTKILFETNQLLQKEKDESAVLRVTAGQLTKLLRKDLVIYPLDGAKLLPLLFTASQTVIWKIWLQIQKNLSQNGF